MCFDAKECRTDTFPLANVHPHQAAFMEDFEKQQGVAFLLIFYSERDQLYYLRFRELRKFLDRMDRGGLKRIHREELDESFFLPRKPGILVPYLDGIQRDLEERA